MIDRTNNDGIYNFCYFSGSSALTYDKDEKPENFEK